MPIDHVFRSTPQLGPALIAQDEEFWFAPPATYAVTGNIANVDSAGVSYRVGNIESGTDGHDYIMLQNGTAAALAADARFNVADDGTFALTTNATGAWAVPTDIEGGTVPVGAYFHGKRFTL